LFADRETVTRLQEKASILEVVSRYVANIKKSGRNYWALCPFHNEKTPSFSISEEKQIFHCFSCGKGGNVFRFVMEIENIDFIQSVQRVADIVHFPLPEKPLNPKESAAAKSQKDELAKLLKNQYHALEITAMSYQKLLLEDFSQKIKDGPLSYLLNRGLTKEIVQNWIEKFTLGYAPASWDFLASILQKKGISQEMAAHLGLLSTNEKGSLYDRFRDRIIFPIHNEKGQVIALGGRAIRNEQAPKYLNSQETPLFQKRKELYGISQAKEEIRRSKRAFIMEGYLDVLMAHQRGVTNAVAPLGTALSEDHLRLIHRFATEVYLVFDGDDAGRNATLRVAQIARNSPMAFHVIPLPSGTDPFDYFLNHDQVDFLLKVDNAIDLLGFELRSYFQIHGEKLGLPPALEALSQIQSRIEKEKGIKLIASILTTSMEAVEHELDRFTRKQPNLSRQSLQPEKQKVVGQIQPSESGAIRPVMHELLKLSLIFPECLDWLIIDFPLDSFTDSDDRLLYSLLSERHAEGEIIRVQDLQKLELPPELEIKILSEMVLSTFEPADNAKELYEKLSLQAQRRIIDDKIKKIKELIRIAEQKQDERLIRDYYAELDALAHKREQLKTRISQFH